MNLTILGCGRFNITDNYNSTGNLVSTDGTHILVDFGRGCLHSLTQLGKTVSDIDAICITHTHPDHVADLLTFFQIYCNIRPHKPLIIIGPTGIQQWYNTLMTLVLEDLPTVVTIHEQPATPIIIGDMTVTTALMEHNVPDIAFKFSVGSKNIVYSGDTGMNNTIVPFAQQADVLMLECSNQPGQLTAQHLNPEECSAIATQANVKQLVLTHYGYNLAETAIKFNGTLTLAKELLAIEL